MVYIILTVTTFEQFPTESRGASMSICMSIGLLGGVGLPYFGQLGTELMIILLIMYAMSGIGAFFLRETKTEPALKNLYTEII